MAELVVIGYPDEATAEKAYEALPGLQQEYIAQLAGASVVTRDRSGKVSVQTPSHAAGAGAAMGALWGGLFGLLFFVPIAGIVMGGIMGAVMGKLSDVGIKDEFRAQVQDAVTPGTSALVAIFTKATPDKAMDGVAPFGGRVLTTSLSDAAEQELQQHLDRQA